MWYTERVIINCKFRLTIYPVNRDINSRTHKLLTRYQVTRQNMLADKLGERGSVAGWGTMIKAGISRVRVLMIWIFSAYLILPTALWQRGCELQTYRHLWDDCLEEMWEPQRLTTLWYFNSCYSFYLLADTSFALLNIIFPLLKKRVSSWNF
jgi:hypothetical protein